MFSCLKIGAVGLALALCLGATTLQRLGLDEMSQKSTGVVVGKVTASHAVTRGSAIYTYYTVQVIEEWKRSTGAAQLDIAVVGGSAGGRRQVVSGAPTLSVGQEYVLFYWRGPSGLAQLMGLSQGLFSVVADGTANPVLVRPAAAETMLDKNGNVVEDQALRLRLSDLKDRVRKAATN